MRWMTALAFLAFVVVSCGQNPHVLGVDPDLPSIPKTADSDENGDVPYPGHKGGKKGPNGEDCIFVSSYSQYPSRDTTDAERNEFKLPLTAIATDVTLPPRKDVRELIGAWLYIDQLGLAPGERSPSEGSPVKVCLLNLDICHEIAAAAQTRIDLLELLTAEDLLEIAYTHQTLRWEVIGSVQFPKAVLQLEIVDNQCVTPLVPQPFAVARK